MTRQGLPTFAGISGDTAGASGLSMSLVLIPPGQAAEPHVHQRYETAIYLLEGHVETRYGDGLRRSLVLEAGEFLFIGPGVPHQPMNLSPTEPVRALVARNDPSEQEHVVPYDPTTDDPRRDDQQAGRRGP
jgi:uncharacterized RmlC-like cupin family protein